MVLINDAGDNSIVLFGGANRTIDDAFIDRVTSAAKPGDILLLQNEITNIDHAMEAGKKAGMRVAFNFAPFDPKLAPELPLSLCDYLFLNRIEADKGLKYAYVFLLEAQSERASAEQSEIAK